MVDDISAFAGVQMKKIESPSRADPSNTHPQQHEFDDRALDFDMLPSSPPGLPSSSPVAYRGQSNGPRSNYPGSSPPPLTMSSSPPPASPSPSTRYNTDFVHQDDHGMSRPAQYGMNVPNVDSTGKQASIRLRRPPKLNFSGIRNDVPRPPRLYSPKPASYSSQLSPSPCSSPVPAGPDPWNRQSNHEPENSGLSFHKARSLQQQAAYGGGSPHCLPPPTPTNAFGGSADSYITFNKYVSNGVKWQFPPGSESLASVKQLIDHPLPAPIGLNYKPIAELGEGGFGFVMAAHSYLTNSEVAIKFIHRSKVPKRGWFSQPGQNPVPMEIHVLSLLRHERDSFAQQQHGTGLPQASVIPNIVGMLDCFEDTRFFILVMEVHGCPWTKDRSSGSRPPLHDITNLSAPAPAKMERRPSHDLFECIESVSRMRPSGIAGKGVKVGGFDEHITRHIMRQVVETIKLLDDRGIIHRDIKDENILIDDQLHVKLIDFGSAVILPAYQHDVLARHGRSRPEQLFDRFYGTLPFASPQIRRGEPYQAEPAEIWSLGILLCVILVGETPFSTSEDTIKGDWRSRIVARLTKRDSCLSSELDHLLSGMLAVNVHERFDILDVLHHPWFRHC